MAGNLIDFKVLEQLIRVQMEAALARVPPEKCVTVFR